MKLNNADLVTRIKDLIKTELDNRFFNGETRVYYYNGRQYDVAQENETIKTKVMDIVGKYATKEELQELQEIIETELQELQGIIENEIENKILEQNERIDTIETRIAGVDYVAREKARINAINIAKNSLQDAVFRHQAQYDMYQLFINTLEDDSRIDYANSQHIMYDPVSKTVRVDPSNKYQITSVESGRPDLTTTGGYPSVLYATKKISDTNYEMYFFGGYYGGNNIIYKLKGGVWSTMPASGTIPQSRTSGTLTYIPELNALVLIGGFFDSINEVSNEVYLYRFNTNTWENVTPLLSGVTFPYICDHSATYDVDRKKIIVIRGYAGSTPSFIPDPYSINGKTFEIDVNTWTVSNYDGPMYGNENSILAYLPFLNKTFFADMFGNTYMLNTTTSSWEQIATQNTYPSRTNFGYTVLDGIGILMFGGEYIGTTYFRELWLFDGENWTQLSTPISTGNFTNTVVGLNYIDDSLQLVLGKTSTNNLIFLKLNTSGGGTSILQTTSYNVPNPSEIILTMQTLTNSKPYCEISTDGGTTFYQITPEQLFYTEGKNNDTQTIFRFTLEPTTEIKGWGFNYDV